MNDSLFIQRTLMISVLFLVLSVMFAASSDAATTVKPLALCIDAGQTAEPISPYIYGQFIEHLGRCIYGGIWAEMLEDRKFFYAVGAEKSHWKQIGFDHNCMVRENSYVGDRTPRITLAGAEKPCGIAQDNLGLIQGKKYTGRIILAGSPEAAPIEVSLIWGREKNSRQTVIIKKISRDYIRFPLRFKAGATTDNGRLEIVGRGRGTFRIGTISLMPADNVKGMRADTLKLLKELNSPIYRWPGGNFVSGYDWRDGVGERDLRPPRKNPAWRGVEYNDFGIDEFIVFCREINTEPSIVVNTGFGDAHSGAQEVEYVNGSPDTPMGKWRAANGNPEPYNVEWWGVGNEMYGKWQLGHMALKHYVIKHNLFVRAMRKVDPTIKLVGVGAAGKWSEGMLRHCADQMDLISEHFYCREKKPIPEHVRQMPDAVRHRATVHRNYRKQLKTLKGKDIRISLDEWNYWYGPHIYGELGTRYFLKDALGIAAGLHEMFRNSDLFYMANYAQTVNVIGCIKTTKTDAAFATTGLVLKLYRQRFGNLPVAVVGNTGPLDVVAAWTKDRRALTVAVVNPTQKKTLLPIEFAGVSLRDRGRVWQITGPDEMAYNQPGKEPTVKITEEKLNGIAGGLTVGPLSICLFELPVK
jgi:alpha-L-arabinofuranosidase